MIVSGRELYEYFNQLTQNNRLLPWDELPHIYQDAWTNVGKYVIDKLVNGAKEYGKAKSSG